MDDVTFWPMATLAGLGAFHGANPAMGWLFAVALGMQERRRAALWRAMLPLGLGHALAVGAAIAVALAMGVMLTPQMMRWPMAALLAGMGLYRLFRHCRARYCGMKVGMAGLTAWSFLMASAHGAGLMVVPVFLGMAAPVDGASCHAAAPDAMTGVVATLVHGAGYLSATALAAWVVFEKLGLGLLRHAWINVDLLWAIALIGTGVLTVVL